MPAREKKEEGSIHDREEDRVVHSVLVVSMLIVECSACETTSASTARHPSIASGCNAPIPIVSQVNIRRFRLDSAVPSACPTSRTKNIGWVPARMTASTLEAWPVGETLPCVVRIPCRRQGDREHREGSEPWRHDPHSRTKPPQATSGRASRNTRPRRCFHGGDGSPCGSAIVAAAPSTAAASSASAPACRRFLLQDTKDLRWAAPVKAEAVVYQGRKAVRITMGDGDHDGMALLRVGDRGRCHRTWNLPGRTTLPPGDAASPASSGSPFA
jgi:hypothetical protein